MFVYLNVCDRYIKFGKEKILKSLKYYNKNWNNIGREINNFFHRHQDYGFFYKMQNQVFPMILENINDIDLILSYITFMPHRIGDIKRKLIVIIEKLPKDVQNMKEEKIKEFFLMQRPNRVSNLHIIAESEEQMRLKSMSAKLDAKRIIKRLKEAKEKGDSSAFDNFLGGAMILFLPRFNEYLEFWNNVIDDIKDYSILCKLLIKIKNHNNIVQKIIAKDEFMSSLYCDPDLLEVIQALFKHGIILEFSENRFSNIQLMGIMNFYIEQSLKTSNAKINDFINCAIRSMIKRTYASDELISIAEFCSNNELYELSRQAIYAINDFNYYLDAILILQNIVKAKVLRIEEKDIEKKIEQFLLLFISEMDNKEDNKKTIEEIAKKKLLELAQKIFKKHNKESFCIKISEHVDKNMQSDDF